MDPFTRIIVAIDGSSGGARAGRVGAALARQWDIPVTLLTVVTSDEGIERARARLTLEATNFPGDVSIQVRRGRSVRGQLMAALRHERGAVAVLATRAQHPFAELMLGSVAADMVRRSPRPIILVGPHVGPPSADTYADLLACIDGTERSERLVPLIGLAKSDLGMRPVVLEVIPKDAPSGSESPVAPLIDELTAAGVEADHVVVRDDRAASGIVEEAARRPSALIAIATEGRDPFARLRQSSTAIAVTREAPCPVLVFGPSVD